MKNILIVFSIALMVLLYSCSGMYDTLDQYSGEIVYPAKFDTIVGRIGYERVEIDLMKAGRIPADQIRLGKAKKTVVEYDDKVIVIDTLSSWLNITGLTTSKLYRFNVYTIDDYENKSVSQEIALIPYTSSDRETLAVPSPRTLASPSSAVVDWPNGISSVLLDYYGLSYSYIDKDDDTKTGVRGTDSRFFVGNLESGQPVSIDITYKIVPRVNSAGILDTISIQKPLVINIPTGSTPFSPSEREVLQANGVTTFTADGVSKITKMTYPIHASSLQDIFYFPNLKELDLSDEDNLFSTPKLAYSGNGTNSEVGGVEWQPFMRRVSNLTEGVQTLKDLLESGIIEKIRYVPHSMGLDDLLEPYVESGVVELVSLPDESLIPQVGFFVDGLVQDNNWKIGADYPATDAPNATNRHYIYKITLQGRSASFALALPKEYQFNIEEYKYLKIGVYAPAKSSFGSGYGDFQRLWPRIMNYMWSFSGNSSFGQEYWEFSRIPISDGDLQKWTDITLDMSQALNRHNRVVVINIGGEPNITFAPENDIIFYFSDIRFTKEQ
ncbi:hypothetical protein EZS27_014810 [termite gut metagenome]|uniref:Uncharacterized protein n=1 Tax=termite gut metagenome TaxID=433724 RepID=A0A5J4RUY9_9ZZZZ